VSQQNPEIYEGEPDPVKRTVDGKQDDMVDEEDED
jgi:hypothetical protein